MSGMSTDPQYVVESAQRIPRSGFPAEMTTIPPSRMFVIKDSLKAYRDANPDEPCFDASQGDGGASLPGVPEEVLEKAFQLQRERGTSYDMPFGTPEFRRVMLEDYWQAESATELTPEHILAGVGGRDILLKAYSAMLTLGAGHNGDVLLTSRVPWISYNWGPYGVGANVMLAPGDEADAWRLTAEGIEASVEFARREQREIAGVVITSPDNPTGKTLTLEEQIELARAALEAGVQYVLFDWIYHWVSDDPPMDINALLQAFEPEERARLMVLDGVTKSLGGSNIRCGHLIADPRVIKFIQSRASHGIIPSYFSQAVAIAACKIGFRKAAASIIEPTNASRRIVEQFMRDHGLTAITGQGYYVFINVAEAISNSDLEDGEAVGQYLAQQHGLAVVPGPFFSQHAHNWVRFSYATPPERTRGALERLVTGLRTLSGAGAAT